MAGRKEEVEELPPEVWGAIQALREDIKREPFVIQALSDGILKIKDPLTRLQCYLLLLIFNELRKRPS